MHAIIILYGDYFMIQEWIQEIRHTTISLPMKKKGCPDLIQNIKIGVRQTPLGFMELIFPKEYADVILTTLEFHKEHPYSLNKKIMGFSPFNLFKKYLKIQDIPKFDTSKKLMLPRYDVSIIPIGIRYDNEIIEPDGEFKGYSHEAL